MKLQELLADKGIDLSRTKLVRHNTSKHIIAQNYSRGYLDIYQSIQTPACFRNCDYVISFLGDESTEGKFLGCYKIIDMLQIEPNRLPSNFSKEADISTDINVFWKMEKTDILSDLIGRLAIEWGKSTRSWCQNGTTSKDVLYILPSVSDIQFVSYDKVLLSFKTLHTIITNRKAHKEWEDKLSAVSGVYLITDTKTGKHYVGSASGEQGGIWGRWSNYAHTKHGGNKRLMELITADTDYCNNFQFSILEVFPIKREKHEVLEYEQLYKDKLKSILFGLNDN